MIYANKLQEKLIYSEKPITISACARGSGQTYGLLIRALKEDCLNVSFYLPHFHIFDFTEKLLIGILEQVGIEYKYSKHDHMFKIGNKVIKFLLPENEVLCNTNIWFKKNIGGLVLIDQVDMFPQYFINYILEIQKRCGNNLVFTTQPIHCGWRDIKTEYGLPVFDEEGVALTHAKSWDYGLINWKVGSLNSRAEVHDYGNDVNIITNIGFSDFVIKDNQSYKDVINRLSPMERLMVDGDFVKGYSLKQE